MSTLKVGTIQDHTNSNTAMTIDSSGRVKPCFAVMNDRGVTANFSAISAVPFNVIDFQRGGTVVAISGSGTIYCSFNRHQLLEFINLI